MVSLISQPFFPENLRGLFSNKKPTSTEHLLFHLLYIIKSFVKNVYSKVCFCTYILCMVKGLFTPNCILKDVILVKTMFKSVFLFNTLHARTRVWAISLLFWHINARPPPLPPTQNMCTYIPYKMDWNYCITCGGGDLFKCPADSKAADGIHVHAHQLPKHIIIWCLAAFRNHHKGLYWADCRDDDNEFKQIIIIEAWVFAVLHWKRKWFF